MIAENLRYLVVKGSAGLCNRLYTLGYCLDYAIRFNRLLIVDWTDERWSCGGQDGFESYFSLSFEGWIPGVSVLEELDRSNVSVYPRPWKGNLSKSNLVAYPKKWAGDDHYKGQSISVELRRDYEEDVVVFFSYLEWGGHEALFAALAVNAEIAACVNSALSKIGGEFIGAHVRYTDIAVDIDSIVREVRLIGARGLRDVVVATDNQIALKKVKAKLSAYLFCKARFNVYSFSALPAPVRKKGYFRSYIGIHNYGQQFLDRQGFTKRQMNIDAIVDFCLMCLSAEFVRSPHSSFSSLAIDSRLLGNRWLLHCIYLAGSTV